MANLVVLALQYITQVAQVVPNDRAGPTAATHALPTLTLPANMPTWIGWSDYGINHLRRYRRAFRTSQMDMPPFPTARFVGGRILGQGGNGVAGLWLQVVSLGSPCCIYTRIGRK